MMRKTWQLVDLLLDEPKIRSPDIWAAETRILPASSAEPGPFRPERTPYMIPIQKAAVSAAVRRITVVCGAQMGKTDSTLNIIGACLDDNPVPVLYVGPTRGMVEKIVEPRFMSMVSSSDSLRKRIPNLKKMSRTAKRISGVLFRLAWAGSAAELASQEVGLALMDEIDRMKFDVGGEGSPIELVDARLTTFANGKLILTSTPTSGNVTEKDDKEYGLTRWDVSEGGELQSSIWRLWTEGSRHEWAWPCPDCYSYFIPRFSLLKWGPKGTTAAQAKKQAKLVCPHCGVMVDDSSKNDMNAAGVFVAPNQRIAPDGTIEGDNLGYQDAMSYWISGLASPWKSWGQRASDWLAVARSKDNARIQGVINTGFGELFRVGGEAPKWEEIRKLGAGYAMGEFPEGPLVLTCGVDVQKDRLIFAVRGWAYQMESWLIEWGELYGDTTRPEVWQSLGEFFGRQWGGMSLKRMAIDSGYKPGDDFAKPDHMVYKFCRDWTGRAVPTKGHDMLDKPLYSSLIDIKSDGRVIKKGLQLWHLNSDYLKSWVHARLKYPPGSPGSWHLPHDITDEYCQQLTAEARQVKPSGAATWVRLRRANHLFDCEYINVAVAHMLNLHTATKPREAPAVTIITPHASEAAMAGVMQQQSNAQRQQIGRMMPGGGSNWTSNWRK